MSDLPRRGALTPDPVAELRTAASVACPDAALIRDCDRLMFLAEERDRLYRKAMAGYMKLVRATMEERDALEHRIANTPARTELGRRAKAEVALYILTGIGTIAQVPRSMILDFLGRGGEGPA